MTLMNRSLFPGLALAFLVLVISITALLLGAGLAARDERPGASLRPVTTSQPVRLGLPQPTPAPRR
jgi:hypothetical protein